jgi:hypothetical protein
MIIVEIVPKIKMVLFSSFVIIGSCFKDKPILAYRQGDF